MEQAAELRELVSSRNLPADIATRGRIVLWSAEGRRRKDIAELLGVSLPTVDRWKRRYAEHGLAGLEGDRPGGAREQVPARVRARVIALTRMKPPCGTGLSHWSTRELAKYLKRTEDITVSWHYIARIWREENLKPHRSGTFKISKDLAFAQKVLSNQDHETLDDSFRIRSGNMSWRSARTYRSYRASQWKPSIACMTARHSNSE